VDQQSRIIQNINNRLNKEQQLGHRKYVLISLMVTSKRWPRPSGDGKLLHYLKIHRTDLSKTNQCRNCNF